jgi:hypothetical protein
MVARAQGYKRDCLVGVHLCPATVCFRTDAEALEEPSVRSACLRGGLGSIGVGAGDDAGQQR